MREKGEGGKKVGRDENEEKVVATGKRADENPSIRCTDIKPQRTMYHTTYIIYAERSSPYACSDASATWNDHEHALRVRLYILGDEDIVLRRLHWVSRRGGGRRLVS